MDARGRAPAGAGVISLLCPSRGRPDALAAMWESALSTAHSDIELVCRLDGDEAFAAATAYPALPGTRISPYIIGPRTLLSQCWNECAERATGEILMHCGDDIRFRTDGWDDLVADAFDDYPDRIVFVHGRDGVHDQALGTHGFLHRRWVDTVGYFVPPLFSSDYNDTWLNEVADLIGRRVFLPGVYTEHLHPSVGKGEWDLTHRERLERHQRDRVDEIYGRTESRRERDANLLRAVMGAAA